MIPHNKLQNFVEHLQKKIFTGLKINVEINVGQPNQMVPKVQDFYVVNVIVLPSGEMQQFEIYETWNGEIYWDKYTGMKPLRQEKVING